MEFYPWGLRLGCFPCSKMGNVLIGNNFLSGVAKCRQCIILDMTGGNGPVSLFIDRVDLNKYSLVLSPNPKSWKRCFNSRRFEYLTDPDTLLAYQIRFIYRIFQRFPLNLTHLSACLFPLSVSSSYPAFQR